MHVGILGGTGPAGRGLAARLASAGVRVTIGSRSKERAVETRDELVHRWPGWDLHIAGEDNQRAASAEVVIVGTAWDAAVATTESVAHLLSGKLVVSMANALVRSGREFQPLVPARGSLAAGLQSAAPESRVVAGLHHLPAGRLGELDRPIDSDVLVCSDHRDAKQEAARLIDRVPGLRPLDAGSLSSAAAVEAFTAVLVNLNIRYKAHSAIRLTGIDREIDW